MNFEFKSVPMAWVCPSLAEQHCLALSRYNRLKDRVEKRKVNIGISKVQAKESKPLDLFFKYMDLLWNKVFNKKNKNPSIAEWSFLFRLPILEMLIILNIILNTPLNIILNIPLRKDQQHLHTFTLQDNSEKPQPGKNPMKTSISKNSLGNHLLHATLLVFCSSILLELSDDPVKLGKDRGGKKTNTTATKLAEGNWIIQNSQLC